MCIANEEIARNSTELNEAEVAAIAFSFLQRRHESIIKLCKWVIKDSGFSLDEAESECIIFAMKGIETYDANKGASLDTHLLGTLREYLKKLIHTRVPEREKSRKDKLFARAECQSFESLPDYAALEQKELLQRVWQQLDIDDAAALELRFIYETTIEEIAEVFDCSNSSAHKRVNQALEKARLLYDKSDA